MASKFCNLHLAKQVRLISSLSLFSIISLFAAAQAEPASPQAVSVEYTAIYTNFILLALVLVFIVLLLLFISANLFNLIRVREGKEPYDMKKTMEMTVKMAGNRYVAGIGTFIILMILLTVSINEGRSVGLQQGYMPEQPIKYSHKLHAGTLGIECTYCHTGATKGKNAWIPSLNVCMNCHMAVTEGSMYGKSEIQKIYDHIGFDAGTRTYKPDSVEREPIQWVRIHNLPDHAYFNHAQHYVVGGVECQTCHGPVEEMEEVYQYSPLSMGWCIDCHRTRNVNDQLYKKMGFELGKDGMTVEDMGGTNCARCHY